MTTYLIIMLLFKNIECESLYFRNTLNNILEPLRRSYDVKIKYLDYGKLEVEKLSVLKNLYQERIIGQERVLSVLLPVINVSRVRHSKRPIVIMFYSPPGVGKTETAKLISEAIYANDNIKRFQLSMYQTEHAFRFLFGSDPRGSTFGHTHGVVSYSAFGTHQKIHCDHVIGQHMKTCHVFKYWVHFLSPIQSL